MLRGLATSQASNSESRRFSSAQTTARQVQQSDPEDFVGIARTQMPHVVFLHSTARGGGMGVRTADEPLSEGFSPLSLLKGHPSFSMRIMFRWWKFATSTGSPLSDHILPLTLPNMARFRWNLLEVTKLILGIDPYPARRSSGMGTLVLYQFDHGSISRRSMASCSVAGSGNTSPPPKLGL